MAELNNRSDYSEVVIKLGLIKEGVPIYRRIRCHILDLSIPSAQHGVKTLKRLAVPLLVGHNGNIDIRHYRVELTYHDTDGDMVLILNNCDIICALKEFIKIGKVKILAEISENATMNHSELLHLEHSRIDRGCQMGLSAVAAKESSYSATPNEGKAVPTIICAKSKHSDQKMDHENLPTNQVLYEFGSCIADLLNVAAKMVKNVSTSPMAAEATHHIRQVLEAIDEQTKKTQDAVVLTNPFDGRVTAPTSEVVFHRPESAMTNLFASHENDKQEKDALDFVVSDPILLTNDDVTANESDGNVPTTIAEVIGPFESNIVPDFISTRPFIHHGYTCDGCVKNPIVGKRYRPISGVNFDLCEKCMANYVGADQFVEALVDHHIPLQPSVYGVSFNNESQYDDVNGYQQQIVMNGSVCRRPFVHGKYMCDGCLALPIIGKRYRPTSGINYDLCQTCMENYTGNETFVVALLDRHIPFQDKWHELCQHLNDKSSWTKTAKKDWYLSYVKMDGGY